MEVNSLKFKEDSGVLPTWKEIEPYIPSWLVDDGCSFPGPTWVWVLVFGWKVWYEMSRICRVHDALYYLGQIEGWEFSWMDKEEMDYVLWEGIYSYGSPKRAGIVAWGLDGRVSEKIFDEKASIAVVMGDTDWKTYVCRKKAQHNIQRVTGWE